MTADPTHECDDLATAAREVVAASNRVQAAARRLSKLDGPTGNSVRWTRRRDRLNAAAAAYVEACDRFAEAADLAVGADRDLAAREVVAAADARIAAAFPTIRAELVAWVRAVNDATPDGIVRPAVSFGYIGNVGTRNGVEYDDRAWTVWFHREADPTRPTAYSKLNAGYVRTGGDLAKVRDRAFELAAELAAAGRLVLPNAFADVIGAHFKEDDK